ncbi:MAG: LacI family DNA-binding transcriptional regulator [Actinomycetes bacterium]
MSVTVRDVARAAGVSLGTVSNVLNNAQTVAPENVAKVQAAIKQLGFVRNDAARQLRAGRSRSIGLIVQDVRNPFFADLARGAEDAAMENRLGILVADSDESQDREKLLLGLFEEQRVLGVLVTPVEESLGYLVEMKKRGSAVVVVDRKSNDKSISSVSVDDAAGGQLAVEHLIDTGRSRIAFAGGPIGDKQIGERLDGAKKAADANPNVSFEIMPTSNLTVLEGRRIGQEIIAREAKSRPDAVFAANDLLAIGILQAVLMSGELTIPKDFALIGYDDIWFAETAIVPLSTVRQPSTEIGLHAVKLLIEEADSDGAAHPQQIVFQPALVIRDSTSPTNHL